MNSKTAKSKTPPRKKAEKESKRCDCVSQLNKQLEPQGLELDDRLLMSFGKDSADGKLESPLIMLRWIGKKPRGKSLPTMFCAYCPFCGKKRV